MGVVTTKSGAITNRDATPRVKNNPILEDGIVRECCGTVEVATGDSSSSVYVMCTVPSNARISSILLFSDDMGSLTTMDFGIYETTANGGAAVSASLFATIVDVHSGALNASDITHEAGVSATSDINGVEKFLWQELGSTTDPNKMYDICGTLHADADVGGTLTLKVRYVV
jgi:hypothetical protein